MIQVRKALPLSSDRPRYLCLRKLVNPLVCASNPSPTAHNLPPFSFLLNDATPYGKIMTGGQNYVNFWTLRPNLYSRLGKKKISVEGNDESIGRGASATFKGDPMQETFLCGVSVGLSPRGSSVVITGTASGNFAVWKSFECIRVLPETHGTMLQQNRHKTTSSA